MGLLGKNRSADTELRESQQHKKAASILIPYAEQSHLSNRVVICAQKAVFANHAETHASPSEFCQRLLLSVREIARNRVDFSVLLMFPKASLGSAAVQQLLPVYCRVHFYANGGTCPADPNHA